MVPTDQYMLLRHYQCWIKVFGALG